MLRKALVVAFTVTMVPYGVEMQAHMVLGLLIVAFALQISLQPYASPLVNSLETAALGVLMLTFWVRPRPLVIHSQCARAHSSHPRLWPE